MITSITSELQKQIQNIRQYKAINIIPRLLTALSLVLLFVYFRSKAAFTELSFYSSVNFAGFIFSVAVLFLLLCFIKSDKLISALLIVIVEIYFVNAAMDKGDYMFSFGLCLALFTLVAFLDLDKTRFNINRQIMWLICAVLVTAFTLFVGIICCLYYRNYWTPCFDFGLFSQMFYYMTQTGECLITCERDGLLNHFAVHFSPIYYLLLPVYALIPSPGTLLVAQAFIVASGAVALVLLCKHYKLSNISAVLFAVCYILYPSFMGGCFWYLHENCFLAPLILWYLYFSEKGRVLPTILFAFLTLLVKEDAPMYVAIIALYFIFTRHNYKCSLFILTISIVYFITVTRLMSAFGEGIMTNRYSDYIYDDGGLLTVIKAVIQNPVYVIHQIFRQEKLLFILQMLLPLCFLPLAVRKPSKLILLIPFILINLMTAYKYQYDIGFQYTFGSGSILFFLAVTNYAKMGAYRRKILLCSALGSVIIFAGGYYRKVNYYESYKYSTEQRETIDIALSMIPDDASVASSTFLLANLSQRKEIYELETTKQKTEYIVLDLRYTSESYSVDDYLNNQYETVFFKEDTVAVFRNCS